LLFTQLHLPNILVTEVFGPSSSFIYPSSREVTPLLSIITNLRKNNRCLIT
jgi:hypothetical protein